MNPGVFRYGAVFTGGWKSRLRLTLIAVLLLLFVHKANAQVVESRRNAPLRTRNVLLVTIDGLRWQEVFGGTDATLMEKEAGGVKDLPALKERFERETAAESRKTLMPFFWKTIAEQGVVFGDP